jgi:hypothetical protein
MKRGRRPGLMNAWSGACSEMWSRGMWSAARESTPLDPRTEEEERTRKGRAAQVRTCDEPSPPAAAPVRAPPSLPPVNPGPASACARPRFAQASQRWRLANANAHSRQQAWGTDLERWQQGASLPAARGQRLLSSSAYRPAALLHRRPAVCDSLTVKSQVRVFFVRDPGHF